MAYHQKNERSNLGDFIIMAILCIAMGVAAIPLLPLIVFVLIFLVPFIAVLVGIYYLGGYIHSQIRR